MPAARSRTLPLVTATQLIGLLLWRSGILLVASYSLFRLARWVLRFVDLPLQLEVGFGLALAGGALVFASLVIERLRDAKAEGELSE